MTTRNSGRTDEGAILEQVLRLVREQTGIRASTPIPADARLFHDLGIAGDDGEELMVAFSREFEVDMTGFDCLSHFGMECQPVWAVPLALVLAPVRVVVCLLEGLTGKRLWPERAAAMPELTVGDLVAWAKAGRWSGRVTR